MYSFKNLAQKSPNTISATIFTVVNLVVSIVFLVKNVEMTPEVGAVILQGETSLLLLLSLFVVQPNTVTSRAAAEQVTTAKAEAEADLTKALVELDPNK